MTALLLHFWPYIVGGITLLFTGWRVASLIKKTGINEQKAKEADSYAKYLKEVEDAALARNRVGGGLPDHDPYRRD